MYAYTFSDLYISLIRNKFLNEKQIGRKEKIKSVEVYLLLFISSTRL